MLLAFLFSSPECHVLPAVGGAGGVIGLDAQGSAVLSFNTPGMYRGVLRANGTVVVGIYEDEA